LYIDCLKIDNNNLVIIIVGKPMEIEDFIKLFRGYQILNKKLFIHQYKLYYINNYMIKMQINQMRYLEVKYGKF